MAAQTHLKLGEVSAESGTYTVSSVFIMTFLVGL